MILRALSYLEKEVIFSFALTFGAPAGVVVFVEARFFTRQAQRRSNDIDLVFSGLQLYTTINSNYCMM